MIVTIASGKGGTGKTLVATNMAASLPEINLFDCDVEEPNAHLFFPLKLEKLEDVLLKVPVIDQKKCTFCGKCSHFCEYHALATLASQVLLFPELCHGCGGCMLVCPEGAISEGQRSIGIIEKGKSSRITLHRGLLNVGEAMATPVIRVLKKKINLQSDTILDAPPGNACSMIETVRDADFCILVTEPTPFGLYDMKLATHVVKKLRVPFGVIINKDGIGDAKVEDHCSKEDIPILMRIPFSREIASLYSQGKLFSHEIPRWREQFQHLFRNLEEYQ